MQGPGVHHINHCEKCIDLRLFSKYLANLQQRLNDILRFDLINGSYKYSLKSTHFSRQSIHLSAFKVDPILSSRQVCALCKFCLLKLSLSPFQPFAQSHHLKLLSVSIYQLRSRRTQSIQTFTTKLIRLIAEN